MIRVDRSVSRDFQKIGDLRDVRQPHSAQTQDAMLCATLTEEVSDATAPDLDVGVLFERLLDAVVVARLTTGRIVLWNPAAEKLFGFPAQEAIGQSIEVLMPAPIAEVHRIGYERYLRTGHGLIIDAGAPVEMPARTKSGEEIRIELSLSELHNSSGERFALAVIRDAMHRKRLELTNLELVQARVARSEAEAALGARDELLAGVAATLQAAPDPDELQRLADALGDFNRLYSGDLTVSPQDGDLVDLVTAAADGARRRAKGRRVLVHTPPRQPATFDAPRTRQVLEQVLDEALHRAPAGSNVEIRLDQISPQIAQLTVSAGGTGTDRGVGIGLQLSRVLMHRQGGTFTATVTSDGGLHVVLTLPSVPARRPSRRAKRT